jgi:DNA/RNA-binding domain of Phe-tRNA-synthetase-like protein
MADAANGDGGAEPSPPKPGEVVFADAEKVLCRRWNWRQDARSLIRPDTRRAIVTVQSNGAGDVDAAVADLAALITRFCCGRTASAVADVANPTVSIEL